MRRLLFLLVAATLGLAGCAQLDAVHPFGDGGAVPDVKPAPENSDAHRGQYMAGQVVGT